MSASDVVLLKQQIAKRTGLSESLLDQPGLASFVARRMIGLGLDEDSAYYRRVLRDPDEMERLIAEVAVGETWFFRYPASFELLAQHCAARMRQRGGELRMLSIACASGEEPYGMAMAAAHAGWALNRIVVDAIDRSEASLVIAREARYDSLSFREPTPDWSRRWFRKSDHGQSVDTDIVATVNFARHDILSGALTNSHAPYDVVFCRNLLIYLGAPARFSVVELLRSLVAANGMLFVGLAEQAILPRDAFEFADARHAFAMHPKQWKLESKRPVRTNRSPMIGTSMSPRVSTSTTGGKPDALHRRVADVSPPLTIEDARALADAGRLEEALTTLAGLQTPGQLNPDLFELIGNVHLGLGQIALASEAFSKVLYLAPNHEHALLQMANLCDRTGNAAQAERFRRRAARAHQADTPQSS